MQNIDLTTRKAVNTNSYFSTSNWSVLKNKKTIVTKSLMQMRDFFIETN